jgi:hypothetical protein
MEAVRRLLGAENCDVFGELRVERLRRLLDRRPAEAANACHLPERMDSGVGASRDHQAFPGRKDALESRAELTLDRPQPRLGRPAGKTCPVVLERELDDVRLRPPKLRALSFRLMEADEWRVEVELEDEPEGMPLGERIRSLDLDDEARERLPGPIIVTRDGPHFFLYTQDEAGARAAERVVGELLAEHDLTGTVRVTRWHPIAEAWRDAAVPLPQTEGEIEEERAGLEEAEETEAAVQGEYDWNVRVSLPHRHDAVELEKSLLAEGLDVHRRWRYLTIGAPTEERGQEVGASILEQAPEGTEVWVEVNPDDLPHRFFGFIPPLG